MSSKLVRLEAAPDLADRVYTSLLDAICEGSLAPGERIVQETLAEQFAVSRQPVLQALQLLKKDGFVCDAPGRGVLVTPLDSEWMLNVYQVRSALDALAARLAARKRFQLDRKVFENGRKATRGRDVKAMIDSDMAFHNAIYTASGNPLIEQSAHLHWRHLRRVMGAVLQHSRQRESVWDEHEAIANAIGAGEVDKAGRLMEKHGHDAAEVLARRLTGFLNSAMPTRP